MITKITISYDGLHNPKLDETFYQIALRLGLDGCESIMSHKGESVETYLEFFKKNDKNQDFDFTKL